MTKSARIVAIALFTGLTQQYSITGQTCTPVTCGPVASNVTGPSLQPLFHHMATCSIDGVTSPDTVMADGSFMKKGSIGLQGAQASLTGKCTLRYCKGSQCVVLTVQDRNIGGIPLSYLDPNGNPSTGNYILVNMNGSLTIYKQSLDSRVPGSTNGPLPRQLSIEGPWTFRYHVVSLQTTCDILPTVHPEQTRKIVVTECKPEWFTGSQPGDPTVNFHGPATGTISLVIPSSAFEDARGPAELAAADWASRTGRTIQVPAGYATCVASDPLCIDFKNDHGTKPTDKPGCASFGTNTYNPTTGVWEGSTSVRFLPVWTGGDPSNLRETIAHELGHYFGLANREDSSCTQANTIMGPSGCYSPTPPPGTTALGPMLSDALAVNNGTYANQNRKICGW